MKNYKELELEIIKFTEDFVRTSDEFSLDGKVQDDSWVFTS